jgi:hypothetical protein
MPDGDRSMTLREASSILGLRRPCRCRAGRHRSTAAGRRRWRRTAGSCSGRRGRRQRRSWRGSARHRRPSGRPWSVSLPENAPPPCGAGAAIGVDDDLAAGQAGVAIGTADDELAGRVDVPVAIVGRSSARRAASLADIGLDDLRAPSWNPSFHRDAGSRARSGRLRPACRRRSARVTWLLASGPSLAVHRLAASCGPASSSRIGGVVDRRRHQVRRLAAGIAEHDALVAGAFVPACRQRCRRPVRYVGRLRMQQHVDLGRLPVEAVLLVADVA